MSKIEVNTIDVQSGSTLTLGSSGKTVTLASCASQSGFGRTGTVDWCTTAKTGPLTVVSGNGYFINTTSGGITVTLPSSPSAGDIVAFKDYAGTWDCNAVTVGRNGSKINGGCFCATLNTEAQSVTLIYVDGTKGWQDIHDSTANVTGAGFVAATGGTVTESGDYKIHTFTSSGCFQVTSAGDAGGSTKISYMVVAGGGGGGTSPNANTGSPGGAGGFREGKCSSDPYTASPLAATPCSALTASVATFPITVGAGGAGSPCTVGSVGGNSIFSTITSTGGGRGASGASPGTAAAVGGDGGSGAGGAGGATFPNNQGGNGNEPPVSPSQGNDGGNSRPSPGPSHDSSSGGGGGAGGAGQPSPNGTNAGNGGAHVNSSITGSDTEYAGGSGGSGVPGTAGTPGGGGAGTAQQSSPAVTSTAGTANTGGSGAGSFSGAASRTGGSGIVVLRYKFK